MFSSLTERFQWHMHDRAFLNWLIESLRSVYNETPSEKVLQMINRLIKIKEAGEAYEDAARKAELTEAFRMINELPLAQQQFLMYYIDKDFE